MKESQFIWMDGKLIPWHEAKIHVLSHTLHYGNGVLRALEPTRQTKDWRFFASKITPSDFSIPLKLSLSTAPTLKRS